MAALRDALRAGTAGAHRTLDGLWDGADLAERPVYQRFLRGMAAALLPLEAMLDDQGAAGLLDDWPQRRRSQALREDLAGLASAPPQPVKPHCVAAQSELWGILYVLEGSRLGGKFLLRQVAASADSTVRENCRFLRHGEGGRLWPSFVAQLERGAPDGETLVVQRALATFGLFEEAARSVLLTGEPANA